MRVLSAVALLAVLAACASPSPSASPSTAAAPSATAEPSGVAPPSPEVKRTAEVGDASFRLTLEVGRERYRADELIDARATLTYLGPQPSVAAWGSGSGLVVMILEQLDGPLDPGGGSNASCAATDLVIGQSLDIPYSKSGGFSADDPNADWYNWFFASPALRLPAGVWRLAASLDASFGGCGAPDRHRLETSVTFQVVD